MKRAELLLAGALFLWGCGEASSPTSNDASARDGTTQPPDGSQPRDGGTADRGGPRADGSSGDAASDAASDVTGDATEDALDAGDAEGMGGDGACTPLTSMTGKCGPFTSCDFAKSYCLGGSVANTCEPLPPACACQETHTCACLDAHVSACDGGFQMCTPYADGGMPWIFWSGCH